MMPFCSPSTRPLPSRPVNLFTYLHLYAFSTKSSFFISLRPFGKLFIAWLKMLITWPFHRHFQRSHQAANLKWEFKNKICRQPSLDFHFSCVRFWFVRRLESKAINITHPPFYSSTVKVTRLKKEKWLLSDSKHTFPN